MKNLPLTHIFIPSKVPSKKLMIILHGRGDSVNGFTFLPEYLNMDDMNYLLLNAPNDYFGGFSWYDLPPNQLEGIESSSLLLEKTLDSLFEEQFDASQSFLFGFSQGSLLTFEFGARYKRKLAGYIAISGYIFDEKLLLKEANTDVISADWLCTHGIYDDVLLYETSKEQVDFLIAKNFNIEFKTYNKAHNIDREELEMIASWIKSKKK